MTIQIAYGDHVGGHTVTDEEDDVLGLANLLEVTNSPVSDGLGAIVVGQGSSVSSRVLEEQAAVCLGCDIDERGSTSISGEKVWKVS